MNLEKVIFGFFIILAMTLNFGFFVGEIDNPQHHLHYELYCHCGEPDRYGAEVW